MMQNGMKVTILVGSLAMQGSLLLLAGIMT